MIFNLEQASSLWCPMVRTARNQIATLSDCETNLRVPESCRCVASQCGMWRWADPEPEVRKARTWWPDEDLPITEPPRPGKVPADAVWVPIIGEGEDMRGGCWEEQQQFVDADNATAAAGRRGYCGLAGAPVIGGQHG